MADTIRLRVLPSLLPQNLELENTGTEVRYRYAGQGDDAWITLFEIEDISATLEIGTVSTLGPNDVATVENVGTPQHAILNIGIPAGSDGLVQTITQGNGISVDATDPNNPIVSTNLGFVTAQMFGAVGNGIVDDTAALQSAIDSGQPLDWGNLEYRITSPLSRTLTADLRWFSRGAKITLDVGSSQKEAIVIEADGHDVTIDGTLTIDADQNAFTAIRFTNSGAYANFRATDLHTRNHYRADTTFTGGDGIAIVGAWTQVTLRADVRDGLMATDAGDPGSQGVTGITISQNDTGAPLSVDVDCYIENIQSEDAAYTSDQDGLKVFGVRQASGQTFPYFSVARISGTFKNCAGRSIKSQMHETIVDGATFIRENSVLGSNDLGNEEVAFQYGAGTLTNFSCFYYSARPSAVVSSEGNFAGEAIIVPVGAFVSKGRIYTRGGSLDTVVIYKSYDGLSGRVSVRDLTVNAEANHPVNVVVISNTDSDGPTVFVDLDSISAGIVPTSSVADSAWVRCTGNTGPAVYVQATGLRNLHGTSGNRPLVARSSMTNVIVQGFGNLVGVGGVLEGTWTPALSASGCTFNYNSSGTYGRWTQVGKRVFGDFRIELATSGNTLAANPLSITGFPFANGGAGSMVFDMGWANSTTSYVRMAMQFASGSADCNVRGLTAAGTALSTLNASAALHATNGTVLYGRFDFVI